MKEKIFGTDLLFQNINVAISTGITSYSFKIIKYEGKKDSLIA